MATPATYHTRDAQLDRPPDAVEPAAYHDDIRYSPLRGRHGRSQSVVV